MPGAILRYIGLTHGLQAHLNDYFGTEEALRSMKAKVSGDLETYPFRRCVTQVVLSHTAYEGYGKEASYGSKQNRSLRLPSTAWDSRQSGRPTA
jgi:hypothetical protein